MIVIYHIYLAELFEFKDDMPKYKETSNAYKFFAECYISWNFYSKTISGFKDLQYHHALVLFRQNLVFMSYLCLHWSVSVGGKQSVIWGNSPPYPMGKAI